MRIGGTENRIRLIAETLQLVEPVAGSGSRRSVVSEVVG